jgi:hypothetical protein
MAAQTDALDDAMVVAAECVERNALDCGYDAARGA